MRRIAHVLAAATLAGLRSLLASLSRRARRALRRLLRPVTDRARVMALGVWYMACEVRVPRWVNYLAEHKRYWARKHTLVGLGCAVFAGVVLMPLAPAAGIMVPRHPLMLVAHHQPVASRTVAGSAPRLLDVQAVSLQQSVTTHQALVQSATTAILREGIGNIPSRPVLVKLLAENAAAIAARQRALYSPPILYTSAGSGYYSFAGLEQLWVSANGPSWAQSAAASVAMCESGGNKWAHNPSGASGLWQILGQVVPGNIYDPHINALNAVAKFKASGDTWAQWNCKPSSTAAAGAYPLRAISGLSVGRIDEGQDFCGSGPLYAIGTGVIRQVWGGWPGGVYILEYVTSGGAAGRYVYFAESISPKVYVGQWVNSGTEVGWMYNSSICIEIGLGTSTPSTPAAWGHYVEGQPTSEGYWMAAFLRSLR